MVESFLSLDCGTSEHIVARSRFLGFAFYIDSDKEAFDRLCELRSRFADATHICYAFVADPEGNLVRFFDDGEPSGTAGAPILEVIRGRGLRRVLVAVVRYFGGTKLGTGGLNRAYFCAASMAVDCANILRYAFCDVVRLSVDFLTLSRLQASPDIKILSSEYSSSVELTLAYERKFDFKSYLDGLTLGKGTYELICSKYVQFCY